MPPKKPIRRTPRHRKGRAHSEDFGRPLFGSSVTATHMHVGEEGNSVSPDIAIWFDVEDGAPLILSFDMQLPQEDGHPLIAKSLENAIKKLRAGGARMPTIIVVGTEDEKRALEQEGFSMGFPVAVDPNCHAFVREIVEDMASSMQFDSLSLSDFAPVPGNAGIDEALTHDYLKAALAFYKATPWTTAVNLDAFELECGGASTVISIMGNAGVEYGVLCFRSLKDFQTFSSMQELIDQGVEPPPIPEVLGLNFDPQDKCHPELEDFLGECCPEWLDEPAWPMIYKYGGKGKRGMLAKGDIELLTAASVALTCMAKAQKKLRQWPPAPGFTQRIRVSFAGEERPTTLAYLGLIQ